jgi:dipeptidyl aminopeptidase/acylaminoacyl peptidase
MAAAMPPTLIICEGPGRLSVASRGAAGGWELSPIAAAGLWPCWSPDGDCFAVSTLDPQTRSVRGSIDLLDASGGYLRTAHHPPTGAPSVIAPRVPHYVQWSPSGEVLGFVAPGTEALGLYLSDRGGSYSSDRIATGAPVFHAWSPDSRYVAIHAGAELSVYDTEARETVPIGANAVGFRTPVFSDGLVVHAAPSPPGVSLVAQDVTGGAPDEIARFEGGVALQAVDGDVPAVSVAMTREPDSGNFHQLWLVEVASRARTLVAKGPFTAAAWAPDGKRVAVVSPAQTGDGRYTVQVLDRDGHYVAAAEAIVPSQDLRTHLGFFDQYVLSHPLWAPDSGALLLAGRLPGDGVAWSFGDRQNDYVWYWSVERGAPLERVAVGDVAFFRPGTASGSGNGG